MSRYTRRGRCARLEISLGMPDGRVGEAIRAALGGYEPRAGELLNLTVSHEEWCPNLRGRRCHCEPDVHVIDWCRARSGLAS